MASLLARFKGATTATLARSATPTSSATQSAQPSTQRATLATTVKRQLYTNVVMSVSVVIGTLGIVLPTAVYLRGGERESQRSGRLQGWKDQWGAAGEEARKQRIVKAIGDSKDDRINALREQLQNSAKYTAPQ